MKLITILAFLCVALHMPALAQGLSASKCLAEAPDAVMPLIDKNTRLDMIDYFMAGQSKPSANKLKGACSILEMNDTSAIIMLTDSIRCQIFVLNPDAQAPIIGIITTYSRPLPDSSVAFYNTRWQKMPGVIAMPDLSAWLTPEGARNRAKVEEEIPFILASYVFDAPSQTIVATNNTGSYFTSSDTPPSLEWLRPEIAYRWDGKRFKKSEK